MGASIEGLAELAAVVDSVTRVPSELAEALGEEPPAAVGELSPEVLTRLADQIEEARHRQAAAMEAGVKKALKGVPLPLRGVVRKALLG